MDKNITYILLPCHNSTYSRNRCTKLQPNASFGIYMAHQIIWAHFGTSTGSPGTQKLIFSQNEKTLSRYSHKEELYQIASKSNNFGLFRLLQSFWSQIHIHSQILPQLKLRDSNLHEHCVEHATMKLSAIFDHLHYCD